MSTFGIQEPCSENWNKMTPTQQGAFCQKCEKEVIDFAGLSKNEIKRKMLAFTQESNCVRIETTTHDEINREFQQWEENQSVQMKRATFLAFLLVFGVSILGCTKDMAQEYEAIQVTRQIVSNLEPKLNITQTVESDEILPAEVKVEMNNAVEDVAEEMLMGEVVMIDDSVPKIDFDEVNETTRYVTTIAGGISFSRGHTEFLEDTLQDEYDENGNILPTEFSAICYPNPATTSTILKVDLPTDELLTIDLYDLQGKHHRTISVAQLERKTHEFQLDLQDLNSGMYLVLINSKTYKETVRIQKL